MPAPAGRCKFWRSIAREAEHKRPRGPLSIILYILRNRRHGSQNGRLSRTTIDRRRSIGAGLARSTMSSDSVAIGISSCGAWTRSRGRPALADGSQRGFDQCVPADSRCHTSLKRRGVAGSWHPARPRAATQPDVLFVIGSGGLLAACTLRCGAPDGAYPLHCIRSLRAAGRAPAPLSKR